jgi:hypothetical protein
LLEGDEEGSAEKLGDADGELNGPVDGSDKGLKEGALLKLGTVVADGELEGPLLKLGEDLTDGELDGPVDGSDEGLEEGALLKSRLARRRRKGLCRNTRRRRWRARRPGRWQ